MENESIETATELDDVQAGAADSTAANKSLKVGLLSVPAAFIQLYGYGCGFLTAWWKRCVRGKDEFHAFDKTFYN